MIVAIDGPSGVGKSTVARAVARRLDLPYLETGAMYRALGLEVLERAIDPEDRDAVEKLAAEVKIDLERLGDGSFAIRMNGEPVGGRIYGLAVTEVTSRISVYPGVREQMRRLQRACALVDGGVLEGRDIGTRVVPDTPLKFFLTADPEVRAERRWRQLQEADGGGPSLAEIEREVRERDERDSSRADSPLRWDDSYRVIDTGELGVEDVIEEIVREIDSRRPNGSPKRGA